MSSLLQRSPEWLEERKHHIGSSDIAAIVGLDPWKSAWDLWRIKTGRQEQNPPNAAMIRGIELEPIARKAYIALTGNEVIPRTIYSKEHSFCMASLDGQTFKGDIIVEIKCPTGSKTLEDAKKNKISDNYMCQVQWQLMLSEAKMAHFFVYQQVDADDEIRAEKVLVEVKPDKNLQKMLLEAATRFWDMVVNDVEPEKPEDKHEPIDTQGFVDTSNEWKKINMILKDVEKKEKEAKAKMLDETDGLNVIGNGVRISWIQPDDQVDWKAAREGLGLTDSQLKPFLKKRAAYPTVRVV